MTEQHIAEVLIVFLPTIYSLSSRDKAKAKVYKLTVDFTQSPRISKIQVAGKSFQHFSVDILGF